MNSSSKDAVSRKGKSLAPVSSAKNISRDVENFKENVMIIPCYKSKEQVRTFLMVKTNIKCNLLFSFLIFIENIC